MNVSYSTMRTFPKIVDGKIEFYSEVIDYDRNHIPIGEPKILEPVYYMVEWSDGTPITDNELNSFSKEI